MHKMNRKDISFFVNNQKIVGMLFYPEETDSNLPGVVFYHGRGSRQERYFERAESLCKKGFIALTFSFRGCGESEGEYSKQTNADATDDALTAFDFLLAQKQVHKERIGICGFSFGSYLAAVVSSKRTVNSLVLGAPVIHNNEWDNLAYGKISTEEIKSFMNKENFENNTAIEAMKQYKRNLLVIEHEKDEVIPETVVKAFYENAPAQNKKFAIIKNAPHKLKGEYYEEATRLTVDWFLQTL